MVSAVAYRQQLQSTKDKFFGLFSKNRGRVLAGYGGSLAGYNVSLQQKQAELTDQLMQKKYESGEINLADLTTYLKKTTTRSWLSIEDRRLVNEQIKNLQIVEQDKIVDAKYKAGTMTSQDVANYEKTKLLTMNPGTEAYTKQQAQVDAWSRESSKDALSKSESDLIARASASLNDPVTYYTELQKAYQTLSADATAKGLPEEANTYTVKAAQAGSSLQSQQATAKKNKATESKDQIVNDFNLAVNSYHDNSITGQDLLAKIDTLERQAIKTGDTDLLDNFNKWVDYVNEDLIYGKAATRGGTRRGGTGGSATDTGWDAEDQTFTEDIKWLQGELLKGSISSEDYVSKLSTALERRKQVIDSRIDELGSLDDTDKVVYEGTKSKPSAVVDKLTKERDQNWGRVLGFTAAQSGNVGLDALSSDLQTNGGQYVPVISSVGTGPGAMPKLDMVDISLVGSDYIQDEKGRYWKIQTKKTGRDTISGPDYQNLLTTNPAAAADYNPTVDANGNITGATNKKSQNVNYVDIFGADGSKIRYFMDASGKIVDYTPDVKDQPDNVKDLVGMPESFQSPDDFLNQVKGVQSQTPTTESVGGAPKTQTPTGPMNGPYSQMQDLIKESYPGARPPTTPMAPKPADIIPEGIQIAPDVSQKIVANAKAPAIVAPSAPTVVGPEATRPPTPAPSTMLTPPNLFAKQYEPLSRAMAGQNIQVAAPPQIKGLPTLEQANQRLVSQATQPKQPNLLDKTKQFISSLFKR